MQVVLKKSCFFLHLMIWSMSSSCDFLSFYQNVFLTEVSKEFLQVPLFHGNLKIVLNLFLFCVIWVYLLFFFSAKNAVMLKSLDVHACCKEQQQVQQQ